MYKGKIPFDKDGNQQHYPQSQWAYKDENDPNERGTYVEPEWRDNARFKSELHFIDYGRGRSAIYFILEDFDGHGYTMFPSALMEVLSIIDITDGWTGVEEWEFEKRGQNYGVKLASY